MGLYPGGGGLITGGGGGAYNRGFFNRFKFGGLISGGGAYNRGGGAYKRDSTVVYDRSCDLNPFIRRLKENGNNVVSNYENLSYIVAIFHVEKHTQPKCILNSENCQYHPNLQKFKEVHRMNTEVAEQKKTLLNVQHEK